MSKPIVIPLSLESGLHRIVVVDDHVTVEKHSGRDALGVEIWLDRDLEAEADCGGLALLIEQIVLACVAAQNGAQVPRDPGYVPQLPLRA